MSDSSKQIGPTLPPNFQTATETEDQDDDASFGPALPSELQNESTADSHLIGPALPPGMNDNTNTGSESENDDFGPALPPGFAGQSRQIGTALPSDLVQDENEDEDDEDMVGPVPEGEEDKNHLYDPSKRRYKKNDQNVTKREEWMLVPGKALAKTLQTKSVTKFSQKSSKNEPAPLTKEQKLELEIITEKEGKMKEFLNKYDKSNKRDVSLLDKHRQDMKKNKKMKQEKTERREFDREKDLNVPKMDSKKKNGFIKEASSMFGTRFSSGKFEKFL